MSNLYSQLNADFTANVTEGCGSLAGVVFTPTGNASITSWSWTFGNSNVSSLRNPSVNYTSPNRYTVTLTVSDGNVTQVITKTNYIKVYNNPTANFSYTPASGCSPLNVTFTSTSALGDAPISSYNWDLKDGSQAPNSTTFNHSYAVQGTFNPSLQITDTNGCSSTIILGPINSTLSPVAGFTVSGPRFSCSDSLTVNFVNTSTGSNLTYLWNFGDGTTSTVENPTHKYNGYNSYTVTLKVDDPNCSDTRTSPNYIRLLQPVADFNLPKDTFCVNEPINITNNSVGGQTYLWTFGDGNGSTLKNPKKTYLDSGTYVISHTVFGPSCSDNSTTTIRIEKAIATFAVDTFICNQDDTVQFIDQSYNAASWVWILEKKNQDGFSFLFTDSTQNPRLFYNEHEGIFSDSLIVTSPTGCSDTLARTNYREFNETELEITNDNSSAYNDAVQGCFPETFTFNSALAAPVQASNYRYSWNFPNGQTSTDPDPSNTLTILNDSSQVVSLDVISAEGCKASATTAFQLGFVIPPAVNVFPKAVCSADSITIENLTPNDSLPNEIRYTIQSLGEGRTQFDLKFQVNEDVNFSNFQDTGYYNLVVKQLYNGCDTTVVFDSVFYVNGPVIETSYQSQCFQNRSQVDFIGVAKGATKFVWDFGDGSPKDSTNLVLTHTYPNLNNYVYSFTAYNDTNSCPFVTDTQTVRLTPFILPLIKPDNPKICLNEEIEIWKQGIQEVDSLQWFIDSIKISESDTFTYLFDQRKQYEISYSVEDAVGCEYTRKKDFFVTKPQASFSYSLESNCLPVNIRLTNTSIFQDSIKWNYFLMGNNDTLFSPNTLYTYNSGGSKSITLYTENINGCSDTVINSNLFNLQPFDVNLRTIANKNICEGTTIQFRNTSTDSTALFFWNFGDGDTLTSQIKDLSHTFDSVGSFLVSLRGEDFNGCVKIDSVRFNVEANPVAAFTADTTISTCYPLEVQFQDTSSGNVTQWFWQIGQNFSVLDTPRFIFENIGKFDVSLAVTTANGCTDTIFKPEYIQTNGPTASFSIDKNSGCVNEPFTFTLLNQQNVDSYVWDFGDGFTQTGGTTATHAYRKTGKIYVSLVLSDVTGTCNVPILDSIIISDVLADFTMTSDTGCVPHTSTFTSTSLGANSLSWDFGEGTTSAAQQETINYDTPGRYFIRLAITSGVGCIDTVVKPLDVFSKPNALVSGDTGICIGQSVQLNASGGTNYLWSPDSFINSISVPNPIVNPNKNIRYLVNVFDPTTCFDTASILVQVVQQPTPFSLLDSTLIIGENYDLNANAGQNFNYQWTPPEGLSCDTCPKPIAMPLVNTTYYLKVSDDFGCFTVYDTLQINVEEKYSLDVPSAFSPNNDGINDVIFAKGWGLKELIAFRIYNRFGELVFESTDFEKGWNGKYKGKDQNIETYIYTVEALTFGNNVISKKGNISLLR